MNKQEHAYMLSIFKIVCGEYGADPNHILNRKTRKKRVDKEDSEAMGVTIVISQKLMPHLLYNEFTNFFELDRSNFYYYADKITSLRKTYPDFNNKFDICFAKASLIKIQDQYVLISPEKPYGYVIFFPGTLDLDEAKKFTKSEAEALQNEEWRADILDLNKLKLINAIKYEDGENKNGI